ncbi:hypothetical protein [Streptomyces albiflavescens]|nr:hypothetical protein [Streptomyces albiflavescens]
MSSPDPDSWPVVVCGANGDWSEFPVGAVEFLAGVYRRTAVCRRSRQDCAVLITQIL